LFKEIVFKSFFRYFTLFDISHEFFLDSYSTASSFKSYKEMAMKNTYTAVDPLHVSSMFFGIKRYIRKYNIKKKY
jgi:hypothetical protein